MRVCTKCNVPKDLDLFYKDSKGKDGKSSQCKECRLSAVKAYNARDPLKHRERSTAWAKANPDRKKRTAAAWTKTNRKRLREQRLLKTYGLSTEGYNQMLRAQGGRCANKQCLNPHNGGRPLFVDHCHATGAVRWLLCTGCNLAIGHVKESSDVLRGLLELLVPR